MAVKRALAFSALALCAGALFSAPLEVKVVGDRVNLRARPVFDAEVAGQVSSGVTLVAPDGIPDGAEWVKVRPPESVDLWIFSALVKDGVVIADDTYVRCGPGQHYKPVGKVGKGFKIEPRGAASGDWLRIAPVPTAELYISSAYVLAVPAPQPSNGQTVQPSNGSTPQPTDAPAPQPSNRQTVKPSNDSTDQPSNRQTVKPSNDSTDQRSNESTSQLTNSPTIQRINEQTNKRINDPPAILSGHALAPIPTQGQVVTLRGRLERLSLAKSPGFTRYQLVDRAGSSRSAAICHIIGLQGQWHELTASEIEIEGRLWTTRDSLPVIDASRVRRIASWEK